MTGQFGGGTGPSGGALRYDKMVENALRNVVRQALDEVGENGLPGNHHFYLTFRTDHPDTRIPPHLHAQYPESMTIILQHQFWGLQTDDQAFRVTLSFRKQPFELVIPWDALQTFADPSVNFALQFEAPVLRGETGEDDAAPDSGDVLTDKTPAETVTLVPREAGEAKGEKNPAADSGTAEPAEKQSAEVVSFDQFRKK